jgi:hypothetical protein
MDLCYIASGIKPRITRSIRKWRRKISNDKQETRETSQTTRKRGPSCEGAVCEEVTLKSFLEISSCMTVIAMIYLITVLYLWLIETRQHQNLLGFSACCKEYGFSFHDCIHSSCDSLASSWVSPMHGRFG